MLASPGFLSKAALLCTILPSGFFRDSRSAVPPRAATAFIPAMPVSDGRHHPLVLPNRAGNRRLSLLFFLLTVFLGSGKKINNASSFLLGACLFLPFERATPLCDFFFLLFLCV